MTVDVHAHAVLAPYQQLLTDLGVTLPGYGAGSGAGVADHDVVTDSAQALSRRVELMDQAGIRRQLLSAMFAPYLPAAADAIAAARCVNDAHAAAVARYPDRLAAYAALPLPHLDASLAELARCLDELGMVGVALQCSCLGESIAAQRFMPLYEELNRRAAVVFLHPCVNGLCSPLITDWGLTPTAGTLFEDVTVALHLIVATIPQRFPRIRFIVAHLGGGLATMLDRLDNQLPVSFRELGEPPSRTARRFFYDTVGHGSLPALRSAVEAFGPEQLLIGSDYPVLLAFESYSQTVNYPAAFGPEWSQFSARCAHNAARLFGDPEIGARR